MARSHKLIEFTYYAPTTIEDSTNPSGRRSVYAHQQINIDPKSIRWMRNAMRTIPVHNYANGVTRTVKPGTEMRIDGLGTIFLKEERTKVKQAML